MIKSVFWIRLKVEMLRSVLCILCNRLAVPNSYRLEVMKSFWNRLVVMEPVLRNRLLEVV